VPALRTGGHTEHGFAFFAGPGVVAGDHGTHRVSDLSATIAALVAPGRGPRLDGTPIGAARIVPVRPQ